jgi:hypothetical protein
VQLVAATVTDTELASLADRELLRRLFAEDDLRMFESSPVYFRCRCSRERVAKMLVALGREEVESVLAERGSVECAASSAAGRTSSIRSIARNSSQRVRRIRRHVARRTERIVVAVIVSAWMAAASARDELTGIVAALRAGGCSGSAGTRVSLQRDAALDAVARRLSSGGRLQDAIADERYPAQKSSSIAIRPVSSPAAVTSLLQSSHCAALTNPAFTRIGVAYQGDAAWVVLAAPFVAPAAVSADSTGARVLELVNAARAKSRRCGLRRYDAAPPVRLDAILTHIAADHSRDMAQHSRMSHTGSDGTTVAERGDRRRLPMELRRGERGCRTDDRGGGGRDLAREQRPLREPHGPGRPRNGYRRRLRRVEHGRNLLDAGFRGAQMTARVMARARAHVTDFGGFGAGSRSSCELASSARSGSA